MKLGLAILVFLVGAGLLVYGYNQNRSAEWQKERLTGTVRTREANLARADRAVSALTPTPTPKPRPGATPERESFVDRMLNRPPERVAQLEASLGLREAQNDLDTFLEAGYPRQKLIGTSAMALGGLLSLGGVLVFVFALRPKALTPP